MWKNNNMLENKHYKLKIHKVYPERSRGGFTLIELMVTIAILAIVVVLVGNLTNYTVGRLKSNQLKSTNDALRSALNIMGQKMNNANDKVTIGTDTVYGFKVYGNEPNQVLTIVSSSGSGSTKTCTYFGMKSGSLKMSQAVANSDTCNELTVESLDHKITSDKIFVQSFEAETTNRMTNINTKSIPSVKITIMAHDTTDESGIQTKLETTFTMDGENVKYLNNP